MDYLNGLPVDYPKGTTLRFVIKRNSNFKLKFNGASYNLNKDAVDQINTPQTLAIQLRFH